MYMQRIYFYRTIRFVVPTFHTNQILNRFLNDFIGVGFAAFIVELS